MFQDAYCSETLLAATALASIGLSVFACIYAGKEPATASGFYAATTNPATIKRWFGGNFRRNLAVRTGLTSRAWVLDVDDLESLTALEANHGTLPRTRQSQTARGLHFWFREAGLPIPSSANRVAAGIDVRAEGGYAVAPPSVHPDGPVYHWVNDAPLAEPPAWLVALALKAPAPPRYVTPRAYGAAALRAEIAALTNTAPGSRNNRLNRASFCLHQLVAGGELEANEVECCLLDAAIANGLVADDGLEQCLATIRSGARAGIRHPRSRPNGGERR